MYISNSTNGGTKYMLLYKQCLYKTLNSLPAGGCPLTSEPVSDRSCDPACDKLRSYCTEVSMCACFCVDVCWGGMQADCKLGCIDIQYSRIRLPPEEKEIALECIMGNSETWEPRCTGYNSKIWYPLINRYHLNNLRWKLLKPLYCSVFFW